MKKSCNPDTMPHFSPSDLLSVLCTTSSSAPGTGALSSVASITPATASLLSVRVVSTTTTPATANFLLTVLIGTGLTDALNEVSIYKAGRTTVLAICADDVAVFTIALTLETDEVFGIRNVLLADVAGLQREDGAAFLVNGRMRVLGIEVPGDGALDGELLDLLLAIRNFSGWSMVCEPTCTLWYLDACIKTRLYSRTEHKRVRTFGFIGLAFLASSRVLSSPAAPLKAPPIIHSTCLALVKATQALRSSTMWPMSPLLSASVLTRSSMTTVASAPCVLSTVRTSASSE